MAIWNEQSTKKAPPVTTDSAKKEPTAPPEPRNEFSSASYDLPRRTVSGEREAKESLIAADLTIEGKIEGAGHVRIAGRFNGDVHVQGNLTIEAGAKLTGGVR